MQGVSVINVCDRVMLSMPACEYPNLRSVQNDFVGLLKEASYSDKYVEKMSNNYNTAYKIISTIRHSGPTIKEILVSDDELAVNTLNTILDLIQEYQNDINNLIFANPDCPLTDQQYEYAKRLVNQDFSNDYGLTSITEPYNDVHDWFVSIDNLDNAFVSSDWTNVMNAIHDTQNRVSVEVALDQKLDNLDDIMKRLNNKYPSFPIYAYNIQNYYKY